MDSANCHVLGIFPCPTAEAVLTVAEDREVSSSPTVAAGVQFLDLEAIERAADDALLELEADPFAQKWRLRPRLRVIFALRAVGENTLPVIKARIRAKPNSTFAFEEEVVLYPRDSNSCPLPGGKLAWLRTFESYRENRREDLRTFAVDYMKRDSRRELRQSLSRERTYKPPDQLTPSERLERVLAESPKRASMDEDLNAEVEEEDDDDLLLERTRPSWDNFVRSRSYRPLRNLTDFSVDAKAEFLNSEATANMFECELLGPSFLVDAVEFQVEIEVPQTTKCNSSESPCAASVPEKEEDSISLLDGDAERSAASKESRRPNRFAKVSSAKYDLHGDAYDLETGELRPGIGERSSSSSSLLCLTDGAESRSFSLENPSFTPSGFLRFRLDDEEFDSLENRSELLRLLHILRRTETVKFDALTQNLDRRLAAWVTAEADGFGKLLSIEGGEMATN